MERALAERLQLAPVSGQRHSALEELVERFVPVEALLVELVEAVGGEEARPHSAPRLWRTLRAPMARS